MLGNQRNHTRFLTRAFIGFWVIYFAFFWSRAFFTDKEGNFLAGHVNLWGDWAAHFTMGTHLAMHNFQVLESPFLIGARFAYPFASNLFSAALLKLNFPLAFAFVGPSFIFSVLTVVALLFFYKTIFRSLPIALLASWMFLLNGGVGFLYFAQDILASPQPLSVILNPPHEYTRLDEAGIKWISVIDSMIIPQRAFNHGFPLTLIALALVFKTLLDRESTGSKSTTSMKKRQLHMLAAAGVVGVMPIIHTHSFLAAVIILMSWGGGEIWLALKLKKPKKIWVQLKPWLSFTLISSLIAVPLFLTFFLTQTESFIQWYPGWLARDFNQNWIIFWLKNWGVMPILAIIGWWAYYRPAPRTRSHSERVRGITLFAPFALLFILLNLFLFQPFAWDNTKLLVWASVGISGLAAFALYQGWLQASRISKPSLKVLKLSAIALLFLASIASGLIDAYRIQRIDLHQYVMYSKEELELAEWVKNNTPPDAIWLTGDQHNHWLFNLTGRQSLLTYRGWLWTHGYNYQEIERDVFILFANPHAQPFFDKYDVDYVVIGPNEMQVWKADLTAYRVQHRVIKETKNYTLLEVKPATN